MGAADAYDAMTSDRPYRSALTKEQAVAVLKKESGKHFHPRVASALIEVLEEEKSEEIKLTDTGMKDLVNSEHYQLSKEIALSAESRKK